MKRYIGAYPRPSYGSSQQQRTLQRAVWISAAVTVIITVISLSELSSLIAQAGPNPQRLDWREVAGRAVMHAETLPRLPHLGGGGAAAGVNGGGATTSSSSSRSGYNPTATTTGVSVVTTTNAAAGGAGAVPAGIAAGAFTPAAATATAAAAAAFGAATQQPQPQQQQQPQQAAEEDDDPPPPAPPEQCYAQENTELWGDVVKWGASFKVKSPGECCDACLKALTAPAGKPYGCNVWVWCADRALCKAQHRECWLKHLAHPADAKPAREGADVGWTSGIVGPDAAAIANRSEPDGDVAAGRGPPRKFHIVTSAQGSAVHWQVRVHYYWYKRQKHRCERELGAACEMGGFTRLLHSGEPDDLMDEVPTFVASPLPESVVAHDWYPVLNRPYAFAQWVAAANITEQYVLMSEPDHLFLRPLPNLMRGEAPAAFPFFYIEPHKPENIDDVRKFVPGGRLTQAEAEQMAPIGNSPTFLPLNVLRELMPLWANVSVQVFKDKSASEKWGWVQEMYAFTICLWRVGVRRVDTFVHFMAQPPWDAKMALKGKPYYILHYTYGNDYDLDGAFTPGVYGRWRFDKRTYAAKPPPRHLGDPPKGMKNDMVRALVSMVNAATAGIPCWDEYARTGKRPATCDEKVAPAEGDGFVY